MLTADIDSPLQRRTTYLTLLTHSRAGIKQGQLELYVHVGRSHPYIPEPCTAFTNLNLYRIKWALAFVCFSLFHTFYRAMLRRARYCYGKLSVRP